ncbi:bile acid:sodium symporter [Azonexus sp.]|jgi:ACR3 family arsenite efflux pump ArsB|uniref:arsenic resistance protein n=1 Tax=Azonexus sp. TaxID=1872668 RepID=UPI002818D05E|nr:bile acid:sodium symporter [Azonexus sp.]MDR1995210.1 bile acid:sodium symporter [Azonexus sp.]
MSLVQRITKNLTLAIPVAMLLGLAYGLLAPVAWLKMLIVPLTFLMVYPMMVGLKLSQLREGGHGKVQLLAQGVNFLVIPFVAFGLGLVFFSDRPFLAVGLLLAGLLPTSGMTISWTGMAGGNLPAAVKMTVLGLILGSILTPFYLMVLVGTRVPVDLAAVFMQIVVIVVLPLVAGQITRSVLIRRHGMQAFQKDFAPRFPPFSTLGVLGIAFVAIALQARVLAADPAAILQLILPLLALYAANYALAVFLGRTLLPRGDAIALVYGTVMRNLSIALALAINLFGAEGAEAALLIALAYVVQVQSAAWSVRLVDQAFGPKPAN